MVGGRVEWAVFQVRSLLDIQGETLKQCGDYVYLSKEKNVFA